MRISTEADYKLHPNLLRLEEIDLRPGDGYPRHCGVPMIDDDFGHNYLCGRCDKVAPWDDISYVRTQLGYPANF